MGNNTDSNLSMGGDLPDFVTDMVPTNFHRNVPTDGMFDHRWMRFEQVYLPYIRQCIEEYDPHWVPAAHNIINRIEKFLVQVLPQYEYKPENERFRLFLRRLTHASVAYLKTQELGMTDWRKEFESCNLTADRDFNEAVEDLALEVALNDASLTDEQRTIVKSIVVEKASIDNVKAQFAAQTVDSALKLVRSMFMQIRAALSSYSDGFDAA